MKKIYFTFLFIAGALQISNAQLTLTKAFNEPVVGNVFNKQYYDSTTAVPKATGAGMNWNFTSLVGQMSYETFTYTTVASTPSPAIFPTATIAEDKGGGSYQMYKATASTYEVQGLEFPGAIVNFSNTALFYTWPVGFGYNSSDIAAGSTTTGTVTTTLNASVNINAAGTGTVMLPGGVTLTNCLQVVNSVNFTLTTGGGGQSAVQKEYNYFHSSNKFPVLTIQYQTTTTGTVVSKSFTCKINMAVVAGITTHELNNNLLVYPNPAKDMINVSLTNNSNEDVSVNLTTMFGQIIKTENLGNTSSIHANLNVSELAKGIYFMNIKIGETRSVKKIVVE